MGINVLEIFRYKENTTDLLRKIRCLSGRVSVFRAQDKNDLLIYRHAIEGLSTKDNFKLLLDGEEFQSKDHFFIGFGGRDISPSVISVEKFLNSLGISSEKIQNLLNSYYLSNLTLTTLCTNLSPKEWRMLRQIACFEGNSSLGLYFLQDPFFEFSDEAKEKFAEKWADLAWTKKQIVVVTELSGRPECWIDNDVIARIPLEKPRQATIGYGGNSDAALQAMVEQARGQSSIGTQIRSKLDLTALSKSQQKSNSNSNYHYTKLGLLFFLTVVVSYFAIYPNIPSLYQNIEQVSAAKLQQEQINEISINTVETTSTNNDSKIGSKLKESPEIPKSTNLSLVSSYSSDIQNALRMAVEQPQALLVKSAHADDFSTNYSDTEQNVFDLWYNELASN
jgi:hypothetical protein